MKIVVIDGATLNPGDLSWDALKEFGELKIYPVSAPAETLVRCRYAEAVITNKVVFNKETVSALPALKYIGVTATGYNIIDVKAAAEKNIVVTNVPTYGTASVSQMAFALLLELCHHAGDHSRTVYEGKWAKCSNFCYWDYPLVELEGLTMGIVGCGRIGQATAKLAAAFGMKVIGFDVYPAQISEVKISMMDSLDALFAASDVVSLHCPLTPENKAFVNKTLLAKMKPSAFLLNTSRGPLIDEAALAEALNNGQIAGAGVDVLNMEPPKPDNPLLAAKNCIITPHIAWATCSARKRLLDISIDNLRAFVNGRPQNIVH